MVTGNLRAELLLERTADALQLPTGANIVEYAAHVKTLCSARGETIGRLNQEVSVREVLDRCHADKPDESSENERPEGRSTRGPEPDISGHVIQGLRDQNAELCHLIGCVIEALEYYEADDGHAELLLAGVTAEYRRITKGEDDDQAAAED